jgi:hypothetical protein
MGLLLSILGFPYWVTLVIWAGVVVIVLGFLAYKAIQKLVVWCPNTRAMMNVRAKEKES